MTHPSAKVDDCRAMTPLFALGHDPQALAVLESLSLSNISKWPIDSNGRPNTGLLRDVIDRLHARALVPVSWTADDRIVMFERDLDACLTALRNPRAVQDAEAILIEGLSGTSGVYAGLRSWDSLLIGSSRRSTGRRVPSCNGIGSEGIRQNSYVPRWVNATIQSERDGDSDGPTIWVCADQIFSGLEWIRLLYQTGCGLWCWDGWASGVPQWVLVVRAGDGFPWPTLLAK